MSSVEALSSASDIQTNFMKLLVAQLKAQDPENPLSNQEMTSQLAQLSELQQLETMNSNFANILAYAQRSYAGSLIGQQVLFAVTGEQDGAQTKSGVVEQVYNDVGGEVLLGLGDQTVKLADVLSVGK